MWESERFLRGLFFCFLSMSERVSPGVRGLFVRGFESVFRGSEDSGMEDGSSFDGGG